MCAINLTIRQRRLSRSRRPPKKDKVGNKTIVYTKTQYSSNGRLNKKIRFHYKGLQIQDFFLAKVL